MAHTGAIAGAPSTTPTTITNSPAKDPIPKLPEAIPTITDNSIANSTTIQPTTS